MITISLDEQGQFETYKGSEIKPTFIAGILFDDEDIEGECSLERERIERFYRAIIWEAKKNTTYYESLFKYPSALHVDASMPDKAKHLVIEPVKTLVDKALPEFIKYGTYNGKQLRGAKQIELSPRKGKYQLFVCLKSPNGISKLDEDVNFLANDTYASNLYFHMADLVIKRLIFENPYKEKSCPYFLQLASRTTPNLKNMSEEEKAEYKKQDYRTHSTQNRKTSYYQVANDTMYRCILANHLIESNKPGLRIENFEVRSIYYQKKVSNMEFLYLADSLCSYLGYETDRLPETKWLSEIRKRIVALNGDSPKDNYIFGYDDVDVLFDKALHSQKEQRYYRVYELAYEAMQMNNEFSNHYQETWFKQLLDRATSSKRTKPFIDAVFELYQSLYSKKRNLKKDIYIYEQLEKKLDIVKENLISSMEKSTIYQLYRIGALLYAKAGDTAHVLECYEKCQDYKMNFEQLITGNNLELESIKESLS